MLDTVQNFQRNAQLLNRDCLKILHIDTANWLFNNSAEYRRCLEVQKKRGVSLKSFRPCEPNWAIEYADCATILGNDFTVSTYEYAGKPLFRVPIPTCTVSPWAAHKDYDQCRNNFLWLGSYGLVHKGLDLVLEAFAEMPNYRLTVCGGLEKELEFKKAYHRELYQTPNIRTIGWVDVASKKFPQIANECVGLIYPSCSEGQSGAIVTCLQAGLIPVISNESGVDVQDFGFLLNGYSVNEIKTSIHTVSPLSSQELESRAHKALEYARANHSRDNFSEVYKNTIIHILEIQDTSEFLGFELPQRSTETVESQADSPTRDRSRTSVHSG